MTAPIRPGPNPDELLVLDHGFVRLDAAMADDLSVVNSARVSFAVRKEAVDERDAGLIRFLMRDRHGTPFEHNSFRFHVRTPIFVAREWFRHRIGCLTGDTEVTFVNIDGAAMPRKTLLELFCMWEYGEHNGHGLSEDLEEQIHELADEGKSLRTISAELGVGRRAVGRTVREGTTGLRDARRRMRKMRLRVMNESTGEFETGHIADVIDKGSQPVYRVTLADGKELKLTENHRVFTDEGWSTLREAVGLQGDGPAARMTKVAHFMTNGTPVHQDRHWLESRRKAGKSVQEMADEAGCSYHTVRKWLKKHDLRFRPEESRFPKGHRPWNKDVKGYKVNRQWTDDWKESIRATRSGPKSNFWRGGISSDRANIARWTSEKAPVVHFQCDYTCQRCGVKGGRLHAHHIVPVWFDKTKAREIGNLTSVCTKCHGQIHRTLQSELDAMHELGAKVGFVVEMDLRDLPTRKGFKLIGHPIKVVAVEYVGMRQTFDLCVEGPWHNFIANGVVVHNSFNEESARYHKMTDDFYVPEVEAVRSQVGKPGAYTFEPVDESLALETREALQDSYKRAFETYRDLSERGVAKEVARAVLPVGIYTQFYWTINARALMNFLSLRNAEAAQYEIRVYAQAIERFFEAKMPITHESFVEFGRKAP